MYIYIYIYIYICIYIYNTYTHAYIHTYIHTIYLLTCMNPSPFCSYTRAHFSTQFMYNPRTLSHGHLNITVISCKIQATSQRQANGLILKILLLLSPKMLIHSLTFSGNKANPHLLFFPHNSHKDLQTSKCNQGLSMRYSKCGLASLINIVWLF